MGCFLLWGLCDLPQQNSQKKHDWGREDTVFEHILAFFTGTWGKKLVDIPIICVIFTLRIREKWLHSWPILFQMG